MDGWFLGVGEIFYKLMFRNFLGCGRFVFFGFGLVRMVLFFFFLVGGYRW